MWRNVLKSDARELSEQYGRDYIDRLIGESDDEYESAVSETLAYLINNQLVTRESNKSDIEELIEKHKNDIQVPVYDGKMDVSLDRLGFAGTRVDVIANDVFKHIQQILGKTIKKNLEEEEELAVQVIKYARNELKLKGSKLETVLNMALELTTQVRGEMAEDERVDRKAGSRLER